MQFDGSNCPSWSKSSLICTKGKDQDCLTGEIEIPSPRGPKYKKWKTENALVMDSYLISMKPEISKHYLILKTACQIWSASVQTFSKVDHTAKMYELRQQIAQFKQGDLPHSIYYSSYQPSCIKDSTKSMWRRSRHLSFWCWRVILCIKGVYVLRVRYTITTQFIHHIQCVQIHL